MRTLIQTILVVNAYMGICENFITPNLAMPLRCPGEVMGAVYH